MVESLEIKTRKLFELMRQHMHEICCHAFDGTNASGEPVLGVVDSKQCISEPCVEITNLLKPVHASTH